MTDTLRQLLVQRAARLRDQRALTAPGWGTLSYGQLRNRVEGVALGLMAEGAPEALHASTSTPWDWVCEVAAACTGRRWDPSAPGLSPELLGGAWFNDERGRQPYHDLEDSIREGTLLTETLSHGEFLRRLRRLNGQLEWDHATEVRLPGLMPPSPALRAALWSALYAGAHAILEPAASGQPWNPQPFEALWSE